MKFLINGVSQNTNINILPSHTVGFIKTYFENWARAKSNLIPPNYTIHLVFSDGNMLAPEVFATTQYDLVNLERYKDLLQNGYINLVFVRDNVPAQPVQPRDYIVIDVDEDIEYRILPDLSAVMMRDERRPINIPASPNELNNVARIEYERLADQDPREQLVRAYFYGAVANLFADAPEDILVLLERFLFDKVLGNPITYLPPNGFRFTPNVIETLDRSQSWFLDDDGQDIDLFEIINIPQPQ